MTDYASRVAKGAALLDERRPGWEREINLEALNIASVRSCTLGQVYGGYNAGLRETGLYPRSDDLWGAEHGFTASEGVAFLELTAAWKALIQVRLTAPAELALAA